MAQILVFGHSITAGQWDTRGGWVQRLRTFLDSRALRRQDENLINYVYNLGIGGDTSRDLLERIEQEIEPRFEPENLNIVMIQIGENDIQRTDGEVRIDEEEFRTNLEQMIDIAKDYADEVLVVGAFPADPELETVPHSGGKQVSEDRRRRYEEIKREVAESQDIGFITLYHLRNQEIHESTEDGIHPTDAGHEKIYEEVRDFLLSRDLV